MTICRAERNEGWRLYLLSWVPLVLMATLLAACLIMSKFSIRIDTLTLSAVLTGPLLTVAGLGLVSSRRTWGWRIGFVMLANLADLGGIITFPSLHAAASILAIWGFCGARIKLAKPVEFYGVALDEFTDERCRVRGRKGQSTVFRSVANGGLYALRAYHLEGASVA